MEEIDHIVSIHASGANEWENLTAACMNCNRSKRERDLLDFLRERLRRSIRGSVGTP